AYERLQATSPRPCCGSRAPAAFSAIVTRLRWASYRRGRGRTKDPRPPVLHLSRV
ncbi:MAG: hypothetical protein AVDCRST_MAG03-23, partial [uncultured Rubrobacteraceae bacterium]